MLTIITYDWTVLGQVKIVGDWASPTHYPVQT